MADFENLVSCAKFIPEDAENGDGKHQDQKIDQKNKTQAAKNYYDIIDGCSSDYEDEILKKNLLQHKINRITNRIEIAKLRNLPSIIFYIFLLIFSVISFRYVSGYYKLNKFNLYNQKFKINYFSEAFEELHDLFKIVNALSHFFLAFLIVCLSMLIKQRMSVPELKSQMVKNIMLTFSCIISVLSIVGLTFYQKDTLAFTREKLKLVDNILFLVYMISTYSYCFLSNSMLNLIDCKEVKKDQGYITVKRVLLLVMGLQVFLYSVSLALVSYYSPSIPLEKNLFMLLISGMGVNCIIFVLSMVFFIWTFKYDLFFVNLNLEIMPDIEYFIDFEEKEKFDI